MFKDWINEEWYSNEYQKIKFENFNILDQYLKISPKNILDIGCGLAWESRLFNQKYGSELWLLDGDISENQKKENGIDTSYNQSADNFLFYNSLSKLDLELKKLDTKNYHLIDCNNITIPENVKFDLICSWLSCGFHYPLSTYKELILKHSHKKTRVIVDIRTTLRTDELIIDPKVHVVQILNSRKKVKTCEIRFI